MERTNALLELTKIKEEISTLLIEKAQIVKDINVPIYEAKAKAEKIIKDAKDEAETTISAANKILTEAESKHSETVKLLHSAKGDIEKFKNDRAKLDQDKIDLDALRFQHENLIKQQRNSSSQVEAQNRADTERNQTLIIEVKQREDSVLRRENGVKTAEESIAKLNSTLEERKANLDAQEAKLELSQKALADKESALVVRETELLAIKQDLDNVRIENSKVLGDTILRKVDLTRQQNDLARQIEIFDNSKAENDEAMKSLKEQQRMVEMKTRQNQEKIDKLEELRKANG